MERPFSYELPPQRIADRPVKPYDQARLMCCSKATCKVEDRFFYDLPKFLNAGDILVLNNTKVRRARLVGEIVAGGGRCELLLIEQLGPQSWRAIGKPLKRFKPGKELSFGSLIAKVVERIKEQEVLVDFLSEDSNLELQTQALVPIPPYIRGGISDLEDESDYQTCFAKVEGALAAPTAALHFTPALLEVLNKKSVQINYLTLHVGASSFLAVYKDDQIVPPGSESFFYDPELLKEITKAKTEGRKVIAVGTTTTRALESMARLPERAAGWIDTSLFIKPGFEFKLVDSLITNFHQPGTTHMFLVEAFMGRELLEASYKHALENGYRFLSYGDGMLVEGV